MTRAYRVPVVGGGSDATESLRARVGRGRPNWWVILAVSLGLMALLVATAGGTPRVTRRAGGSAAAARISPSAGTRRGAGTGAAAPSATTTTTTAPTPPSSVSAGVGTSLLSSGTPRVASTPLTGATGATTTTLPPTATTTTTDPNAALPADRTQTQGYLDPPTQTSNQFGFTGTGSMRISVVWSGDTYLTMEVSCPNGSQNVGGTSAMAATLPDASGSCLATVSEPASESTSLTYTISIGPSGG